MADASTTVQVLKDLFAGFVRERDWEQFHSPKNLVMGLAVETSELMEHFLWMELEASREVIRDPALMENISDEVADVAGYLCCLCNSLGIDLSDALQRKLKKNEAKYPAEKYRGRYKA